jgi:hypothetical protein
MTRAKLKNRPRSNEKPSSFAVGPKEENRKLSPQGRISARRRRSAQKDSEVDRRIGCQWRRSSRRLAAVALKQPTEPLFTADFAQWNDLILQNEYRQTECSSQSVDSRRPSKRSRTAQPLAEAAFAE